MSTQTIINPHPGANFETVWAALQENAKQLELLRENSLRSVIEMELLRESQKETARIVEENSKQTGGLSNTFGELAEHLVAPGIVKRFSELGYHFDIVATKGLKVHDAQSKVKAEIDIHLENAKHIVAVEVKSRPKIKDIEHHIKRIEILKEHRDKDQEKPKKIMGAIAGAIFGSVEKKATVEAGFYVLEQSGDTMKMDIPDGFVPREW